MRRGGLLASLVALSLVVCPVASASAVPDRVLSNEITYTRWAYVARIANVYVSPSITSRRLTRLHWRTEDGFSEVYVLLGAHWDRRGMEWIKLRIPMRPNGHVGWVEANALGNFHLSHQRVLIDRHRLRLYFYERGHLRWSAPVGVGQASTPTPAGYFWIRERFTISDPSSGYYPYAFGTSDYSTLSEWPRGGVVGIHGPYFDSGGIPGYISHGCVRLKVPDDRWLGTHLRVGTPVRII